MNNIKTTSSSLIFTQALGLCPLLIMSDNLENALFMGTLTLLILPLSAIIYAAIKQSIAQHFRLVFIALIVTSLVSIAQFLLQAYKPQWVVSMGLMLPLIASHSLIYGILDRSENKGLMIKQSVLAGLVFFISILCLALLRQALASTLWANIPFFLLPAGALLSFALLVAAYNAWQQRGEAKTITLIDSQTRRQRVTGRIA